MQKEGGATHLTNEAKNTFYRKMSLPQNMFSTKKKTLFGNEGASQ